MTTTDPFSSQRHKLSKRNNKCVLNVFNKVVVVCDYNGNDIKTDFNIKIVITNVGICCPSEQPLF